MKKIVALFLTLAMLLSIVGTAGIAAEAKVESPTGTVTVPEVKATLAEDGTVTVTCDAIKKNDDASYYGYAYVGENWDYVSLTFEDGKFTGKNESIAGQKIREVYLSEYVYKYNDDYTKCDRTGTTIDYDYDSKTGELYRAQATKTKESEKQVDIEYTDSEGNKQTGTTFVVTSGTTDTSYKYWSDGMLSNEYTETATTTGDEKAKTTESTRNTNNYSTTTGKMTTESVQKNTNKWTLIPTQYGYYDDYSDKARTQSTSNTEAKRYDSQSGEYTGKSVDSSDRVYSDGAVVKQTTTNAGYNKDGYQTSSSKTATDTEYNAAKDKRTVTTSGETAGYNDYGKLLVTGETTGKQEQAKLESEYGYSYWSTTASSSNATQKNKNGAVIYSSVSSSDDKGNSSSETKIYDQFGALTQGTKTAETKTVTATVQSNRFGTTYESCEERDADGRRIKYAYTNYNNYKDGANVKSSEYSTTPEYQKDEAGNILRTLTHEKSANYDKFGGYTSSKAVDETYSDKDNTITRTTTTVNYVGKPETAEMHDKVVESRVNYLAEDKHGDYANTTTRYDWDGSVESVWKDAQETTKDKNGNLVTTTTSATFDGAGKQLEGSVEVEGIDDNGNDYRKYHSNNESGYDYTYEYGYDADDYSYTKSETTYSDGSSEKYSWTYHKDQKDSYGTTSYYNTDGKLKGTKVNDLDLYDKDEKWIGYDDIWTDAEGKTIYSYQRRRDDEGVWSYNYVDGEGNVIGYVDKTDETTKATMTKTPDFDEETFTLTGGWNESVNTPAKAKDEGGNEFSYTIYESKTYNKDKVLIYEQKNDSYADSYTKEYSAEGNLTYDHEEDKDGKYTNTWYANPGYKKSRVETSPEYTYNDKGQQTSYKSEDTWYGLDGELDRRTVYTTSYEYNADGQQTKRTYTEEYRDGSDKAVVTKTDVWDQTDKNNWKVTYTKADGTVIGYTTYSGFETKKEEGTTWQYNPVTYYSEEVPYTYYEYGNAGTITRVTPDYNPYTGKVFGTTESTETRDKDGNYSREEKSTEDGHVTWESSSSSDKDGNTKNTVNYYENEDYHKSSTSTTEYDAKTKKTTGSGERYRYSGAVRSSWETEAAYDQDKDLNVSTTKYYNSEGKLVYTTESLGETRAYGSYYGGYNITTVNNTVYKDAKGNEIGYQKYDEAGNYSAKIPETTYSGNLSGSWTENTRSADGKTRSEKQYNKNGVLKYESNTAPTAGSTTEYWTWADQAEYASSWAEDGTGMTQTVTTNYNEDGTQRTRMVTEYGRKTGTHFDTTTATLYGNNDQVVYTYSYSYDLQKDESKGEYKDASGKVIGYDRKENDDGSWSSLRPSNGNDEYVEEYYSPDDSTPYAKRTGALLGFVEEGEDKDGNRYTICYDANMKETARSVVKLDNDGNKARFYYKNGSDQPYKINSYEDDTTTYYNSKGEVISSDTSDNYSYYSIVKWGGRSYYNNKGELTYKQVWGVNSGANNEYIETVYLDKDGKEIGVRKTDDDGVYTEKYPTTTYANNITGYYENIHDSKNGVEISRRYDKNNVQTGERYRKTEKTITDEAVTYTTTTKDGKVVEQRVYEKDADNNTVKSISNSYGAYDGRYAGGAVSYPNHGDSRYNAVKHYDENSIMSDYGWSWNENDYSQTETYWPEGTPKEYSWRDQLGETGRHEERYTRTGDYDYWYDSDGNGNYQEWNYWYGDGTLSMYTESKDGVTNITYYDRNGNVSGYDWAIVDGNEPNFYSQDSEVWSATSLLYKKHIESDPDNAGNIVTWTDNSGNVKVMNAEGTTVTLTDKTDGWHSAFGNEWYYVEGGQFATGWKNLGGVWYYFNADGSMATGTVKDGNSIYAMAEDGAWTDSGWNQDANGNWQYVENGVVATGWRQLGGKWYYFDDGWYVDNWAEYDEDLGWQQYIGGNMATGAAAIWNGSWTDQEVYFFNSDGTWDTTGGWKCDGQNWYYFSPGGQRAIGWKQINGTWYYFNNKGVMCNGWSGWYYLGENGEMLTSQWFQERFEDDWYYVDETGLAASGWKKIDGDWYYFGDDGIMASDEWVQSGSDWYYQKEDGAMATGWEKADDEGNWYYFGDSGAMQKGWVQDGNTWYYTDEEGKMVTGTQTIDGRVNIFDENGAWIGYGD